MAISAGAALIASGAISTAGQLYANQKTLDSQQANNDLSVNLANTAHQREMLDLRAAGLNPILSASGSGASVPQLGTAQVGNPGEGIAEGISSATRMAKLDIPLKEAQIGVQTATAKNLEAQNANLRAQNRFIDSQIRHMDKQTEDLDMRIRYPGKVGDIWRSSFGIADDVTEGLKGVFGFGKYADDYAVGHTAKVIREKVLGSAKAVLDADKRIKSTGTMYKNSRSRYRFLDFRKE